jgi:hypothetical protein
MMGRHARAEEIAQRLDDGRLPKMGPLRSWVGYGKGRPCDGCGEPVILRHVEIEHDFEHGKLLRFHAECSVLWEQMVVPPSAD